MAAPTLDVPFVRSQFPAFAEPTLDGWSLFENAGGSYACRQTIDALDGFYRETKVQTHYSFPASAEAGHRMDHSRQRWADALGVAVDECHFGPSTSANTTTLAHAFGELIGPGDTIVVTNQDHEANTGVFRRMAERVGATVREWQIDPATGLLDLDALSGLLDETVVLVTFPHVSNIVAAHNDVARICGLVHDVGAVAIVDGVAAAPHGVPNVGALGADVYLFSLYKVFSVHQGLMTVRRTLLDRLPNQSHFFNDGVVHKRLNPAGPDHAQVAAAGAVLDYVDDTAAHHGIEPNEVPTLWRSHEARLLQPLLDRLAASASVRLIGPTHAPDRSPTLAFVPIEASPAAVVETLVDHRIMASAGHYYSFRTLEGLGIDPSVGVVRLSFVHYTSAADLDQLHTALDAALGAE